MIKYSNSKIKLYEPFLWIYYIWYYLPITRGYFRSGLYNRIFFLFFVAGCFFLVMQLVYDKKKIYFKVNMLLPVLIYMITMTVMYLLEIGDAADHIRVSFTFWGSVIVFFAMAPYETERKRLTKLFLILFIITFLTSLVGVVSNSNAARILTYSANEKEEDLVLQMLNIGGICFFQGLVLCVPIIMTFILKKQKRVFNTVCLILIFIAVVSASFTISIFMFFAALALGYLVNSVSTKRKIIVGIALLVFLFVPWIDVLSYIADVIQNETIAERLTSIVASSLNETATGNLNSRLKLYAVSLDTFLRHPFGIGPYYSYVALENGIGYHSQFLDDLARYGVYASAFYIMFFVKYYKLIKNQWKKLGMQQVAFPITILYLLFLTLNLGFTSAHESIMVFFLIPVVPDLIIDRNSRKINKGMVKQYESKE